MSSKINRGWIETIEGFKCPKCGSTNVTQGMKYKTCRTCGWSKYYGNGE